MTPHTSWGDSQWLLSLAKVINSAWDYGDRVYKLASSEFSYSQENMPELTIPLIHQLLLSQVWQEEDALRGLDPKTWMLKVVEWYVETLHAEHQSYIW